MNGRSFVKNMTALGYDVKGTDDPLEGLMGLIHQIAGKLAKISGEPGIFNTINQVKQESNL